MKYLLLSLPLLVACSSSSSGTSGASSSSSTSGTTSSGAACRTPDLYAACWTGGGLVGLCSESGTQTNPATVSAPAPGGGASVVANIASLVFTGPTTLWALDEGNAQIDVLDTATWPPTNVMSLAAGTGPYDPVAMVLCGGQVLVVRTTPPLVEALNPVDGGLINEVPLTVDGGSPDPDAIACSDSTAYVTDEADNVLFAIDLGTLTLAQQLPLPTADQNAALAANIVADGGTFSPSLGSVAVVNPDAGAPQVFAGLQNYALYNGAESPAADSQLLASGSALASFAGPYDLANCGDVYALTVSADQSTIYATCAGSFHIGGTPNAGGQLNVFDVSGLNNSRALSLPLSDPGVSTLLSGGSLAVGDTGSAALAFYNPADGGVTSLTASCPLLPDGGVNPLQFISAVVTTPAVE